jgi:MoaA/NifB/PqqE/SkfB family radical SAM enzyme
MDLRENKGLTPVESGFPISAVTIDLTKRCNLACDYCNPAGTPILMADLTYKAIEDIKVGDKIIGFVTPEEKYKHTYFTESVVEAKMERDADLVEVHTSNGVFKCTPDHKWFNGRSYVPAKVGGKIKYVSDPVSFKETDSYKIGYIHGMMVCDGCFSDGIHEVKSGPRIGQMKKYKHVRLALNDIEPIDRIERYLSELGLPSMNRFQFTEEMTGLRSSNIDLFDRLAGIPHDDDTLDYVIGWTAGIFDAEGSYDGYNLRISQLEGEVLDGIIYALESLGFDIAYEDYHDNGVRNIRIENGYSDVIKFFAMCNPCIERKKEKVIVGKSVYGNSEILDIIPAGHDKVYSMQTSTHNYIAHGHTSRNCFAHCFNKDRDKADLKPELGKQIIGWLMREDVRGDNKHLSISFWGGEPLLKFDLMKELILYAEDKAKELGLTLEFGGTTNVTLLTEDKLDFLTEHKCYFLLSIDGRPEHHDMHRKLANGQGSYELVDKNLDAILRKWPNAKVRLSHSVETIDTFLDNLKFLYNRGFRDIAYSPVSEGDWNEERLQVLQKVWTDIADWYIERFQAGDPVHLKFLEDA